MLGPQYLGNDEEFIKMDQWPRKLSLNSKTDSADL